MCAFTCRKSGMSSSRPPRSGSGTNPQQASRFSPLRPRAGMQQPSSRASSMSSRQSSGQLQQTGRAISTQGSQPQWQSSSGLSPQRSHPQTLSTSGLSAQSSQLGGNSVLSPHSSPQWQSNSIYSPHSSLTQQQSNSAFRPQSLASQQQNDAAEQQVSIPGVTLTSSPRFPVQGTTEDGTVSGSHADLAPEGTLQQPLQHSQEPSQITFSSQPRLQVQLPSHPGSNQTLGSVQGAVPNPEDNMKQPEGSFAPSLGQQASTASQQASTSTPQNVAGISGHQGRLQQPRTSSGMQRQGWFQDELCDDAQDPNLHNPRFAPSVSTTETYAQPGASFHYCLACKVMSASSLLALAPICAEIQMAHTQSYVA